MDMIGFLVIGLLLAIPILWCYAFFLLWDTEKGLYRIFAALMTGLIGTGILLGLREIYRYFTSYRLTHAEQRIKREWGE